MHDSIVRDISPVLTRSLEEVLVLYRQYQAGATLDDLGAQEGISYEAIRRLFKLYELPRRTASDAAILEAARRAQEAVDHQAEVERLYMRYGTIDEVAARITISRQAITTVVNAMPDREAYRRTGTRPSKLREELIDDLQRAARLKGEPLGIPTYRSAAKVLGLVAYDTIVKFFSLEDPEQPWLAALDAAEIEGFAPKGKRPSITAERCIEAVMQFVTETGGRRRPFREYDAWALERPVPSGATVRKRVGWSTAMSEALARLEIA